ncbi:AMP-binding protein [Acrocarpospora catenulata]|uniref:AMP-binding protein n=1 Tax=Acrocarpospora catenulata TaxID=2836182 RepID=UPI001BD982D7|nr:AMP-binding protein [Acrocarpospora catenulata]
MRQLTLWESLGEAAHRSPDRVYCSFGDTDVTLRELRARAVDMAGRLAASGVARGDRVAVMLPNCPAHLDLVMGLLALGAVYVPLNVRAKGPGLAHILAQSEPVLVVADESTREALGAAVKDSGWSGALHWLAGSARLFGESASLPPDVERSVHDVVSISYTSGTTGPPKGVKVTDAMLRVCAGGVATATDAEDGDVYLMWEPFFHVGGLQMLFLAFLRDVRLHILPRFSASRFWDQARACGARHIHYLGGVVQILLRQPPSPDDRDHSVRTAWGAGATEETWREFERRFGVRLREVYGLTESSSINTVNVQSRVGSIGRAIPGFDVQVVDQAGTPVRPGERGEIRILGVPGAMTPGYFRNEEATAALLRPGGWLYTGDLATADEDGYLYFLGRMTDNVRVGGENVSAWEVESVARAHPQVADCAVVGVKGEVGEQDILLYVQRVAGPEVSEQEIVDWCRNGLAPYQVPRYVAWVEEFSRGPSMRILKDRLAATPDGAWDRVVAEVHRCGR